MKCFKHYSELTNYQSFVWLWLNDGEAKYYWLGCWIVSWFLGYSLNEDVGINVSDFGMDNQSGQHLVYCDFYDLQEYYEK